ncbi:hypothetical protein ACFV0Z_12750 [Streptomyces xiamenensis]|uniref:hypothetical protein n=1 Tax=Streptomyces xiamenensis TaxID=408015 RepID=UPI0036954B23
MPDETQQTDWWDRLYDGDATTTPAGGAPTEEPRVVAAGGADRMPDWRTGQHADLSAPEADDDQADEDVDQGDGDGLVLGEGTEQVPAPSGDAPAPGEKAAPKKERWVDIASELSHRSRVLLYNGAAAGIGWGAGMAGALTEWMEDCGEEYSITAALILGLLAVTTTAVLDHRLRGWFEPFRFVARIPLATAVLAVGLYAPAASNL